MGFCKWMVKIEPYPLGHMCRKGQKMGCCVPPASQRFKSSSRNLFLNLSSTLFDPSPQLEVWGLDTLDWRGHRLEYSPFSLFNVEQKTTNRLVDATPILDIQCRVWWGEFNDFGAKCGRRWRSRWAGIQNSLCWPASIFSASSISSVILTLSLSIGHGLGLYLLYWTVSRVKSSIFKDGIGRLVALGRNTIANDFSAEDSEVEGESFGESLASHLLRLSNSQLSIDCDLGLYLFYWKASRSASILSFKLTSRAV